MIMVLVSTEFPDESSGEGVEVEVLSNNKNAVQQIIQKIVVRDEDAVAFALGYAAGRNVVTKISYHENVTPVLNDLNKKYSENALEAYGLGALIGVSDAALTALSRLSAKGEREDQDGEEADEEETPDPSIFPPPILKTFKPCKGPRSNDDDRDAA